MKIADILREDCIIPCMKSKTKKEAIIELLNVLEMAGCLGDKETAKKVILERENMGSTAIGDGIAIPHGKMKGLDRIVCVFGSSKEGVDFDALDKKPVHIFFLLLASEDAMVPYLKILSKISRLLGDPAFRKRIMKTHSRQALYRTIIEEEEKVF